jgi:putative nucleotidyltransferase with HDIG domain
MPLNDRVQRVIIVAAVAALLSIAFVFWRFPPEFMWSWPEGRKWLVAFGTLLALSIVSTMMALKISEGGATTSLDFVPQLAAVLLVGPAGATAIAAVSETVSEILFYKKTVEKKVFNTSQMILSAAAAGIAFQVFGGQPSLDSLDVLKTFPPFLVAILAYFAVNTGAVSYVVAAAEGRSITDTWRQMAGGLIAFDFAMSLLAFLVALLYVGVGPEVLLFAVIPLFGLRYSYGVNYELKQLNTDLLRLLIKTIEAQDLYTSGHSIRVAETSRLIARALRIGAKQARIIETAALLHDIGKIDVVYLEILRQKGPLTPKQRELIRAHPERGVDILRSIRSLHLDVLLCVRHHHERWDGEGYPARLAGEEIPIGARIIMVGDTVDAMTTARPYRDPLPMDVVRDELIKNRGTQFDPEIIDLVTRLDLLSQIETSSSSSETRTQNDSRSI